MKELIDQRALGLTREEKTRVIAYWVILRFEVVAQFELVQPE